MDTISREIQSLGGRIIQECVISDIFYHGMLVELPRIAIEELVNNYEEIELSKVDDIMFFGLFASLHLSPKTIRKYVH